MLDTLSHSTSIAIDTPAARVLAFIADPARLKLWSFGIQDTTTHEGGLVEGRSVFDGQVSFLRIEADAEAGVARYWLGARPDALAPRIVALVVKGETIGRSADSAVLTLVAWRGATMTDDRWRRLVASHEFEVVLLKSLIERGA